MPKPRLRKILGDNRFRRRAALRRVGGVGRDRLDAQKIEQPPDAVVEFGVDARQDRVELLCRNCHSLISLKYRQACRE